MRINKTYLKLGVALTATFGFGFLLGRAYEGYKVQKVLDQVTDKMRDFKEEMDSQVEVSEDVSVPPEEPPVVEETKIEEGDEDMRKHISIEETNETIWKGGEALTRDRIEKFPLLRASEEETYDWGNFCKEILSTYSGHDFFVEDTTPWGCAMEHPVFCVLFDKENRQFYWNEYSFIDGDLSPAEINLVVLGFFCFGTYREDADGSQYPYLTTTEQNVFSNVYLRHDDHVYTDAHKTLYFPTIEKEVFVRLVDSVKDEDEVRDLLAEIINYNGGFDPYFKGNYKEG